MTLAVVVTANHYVLDGVDGIISDESAILAAVLADRTSPPS